MKGLLLETELPKDYGEVETVIKAAFHDLEISDHDEHILVARIRQSPHFVPPLSIVAKFTNRIVGHILLSEIQLVLGKESHAILALAPMSVLPEYQGCGVGSRLVEEAHQRASRMDYPLIVVIGHEEYYPRFGYLPAREFGIGCEWDVPKENFMVYFLDRLAEENLRGKVIYPAIFTSQ